MQHIQGLHTAQAEAAPERTEYHYSDSRNGSADAATNHSAVSLLLISTNILPVQIRTSTLVHEAVLVVVKLVCKQTQEAMTLCWPQKRR